MKTDVAVLPPKAKALEVYQIEGGLDPYVQKIRDEVMGHVPDLSTKKGRDAIASLAYKVRKSKTALDSLGKQLVDELKEVPKKIDAERKRMRDALDELADEVRKPLTDWEEAEENRVNAHKAGLDWFRLRADENRDLGSDELKATLDEVHARIVDESWQEYEAEAHRIKARTIDSLTAALAAREKYEAEQKELGELRRLQAEREQKEREEQIAKEAEERARREAEEKAAAERLEAARREAAIKAAAEKAERDRLEAIEAQKRAEERAELERRAAAKRAEEAAEAARLAEIKRQNDEADRIERERQARESDRKHKANVNNAAMVAFVAGGMSEDCAKQAVTLIAKGSIPAVRIEY